jgi:ribosomal protein S18 acetylase RimI-like enzyme
MDEITISSVHPENLDFLKILQIEAFNQLYHETRYEASCQGFAEAAYLAYWNDSAAGEIMIEWKVKNQKLALYIVSLSVAEGHRRKGIATRLLTHVKNIARDAAYVYLHTQETNLAAQALYRKEGFVPVRRVPNYYSQEGLDAIVFQWTNPSGCRPTEHYRVYSYLLWHHMNSHPFQYHPDADQFHPLDHAIEGAPLQHWNF